jgi:hypothetical protein
VLDDEGHAAAALGEDAWFVGRQRLGDDTFVVVVVDAADDEIRKLGAEVASEDVVVDEEPARVLGIQAIARKVGEGDQIARAKAGWLEDGVQFGPEGEVCSLEVGEGYVQDVGGSVGAEVGEEEG